MRGMRLLRPYKAGIGQFLIICLSLNDWKYDLQRLKEMEALKFFIESGLEPITEMIELAETSESI